MKKDDWHQLKPKPVGSRSLTILDHPWPIPISSILAAQTPTNMDGQSPVVFPMCRSRQWHQFVSMFWWELPTGCPNKHPQKQVPWEVPPSGFAGSQRYSKSTGLPTSVSLWEDHKWWINHDRSIILGQTYHLWLLYLSNPYWTPHFINITSSWGFTYNTHFISYDIQLQWELSMIFHDVPHPRHFVTSETMDPTMFPHVPHPSGMRRLRRFKSSSSQTWWKSTGRYWRTLEILHDWCHFGNTYSIGHIEKEKYIYICVFHRPNETLKLEILWRYCGNVAKVGGYLQFSTAFTISISLGFVDSNMLKTRTFQITSIIHLVDWPRSMAKSLCFVPEKCREPASRVRRFLFSFAPAKRQENYEQLEMGLLSFSFFRKNTGLFSSHLNSNRFLKSITKSCFFTSVGSSSCLTQLLTVIQQVFSHVMWTSGRSESWDPGRLCLTIIDLIDLLSNWSLFIGKYVFFFRVWGAKISPSAICFESWIQYSPID